MKWSLEKVYDSEAIQEYIYILYSCLFLCKFDNLLVLVTATEQPINIFGFVQCKYI